MKLLHVLDTFDPAAGGPVEGVRQSTVALSKLGHTVEIATLDAPDAPFLSTAPAPIAALGPGHAKYGFAPRALVWLREHAPRFDAVIVHGLWQYHGLATRYALQGLPVPYYVFAHGMLDPWFKRTFPLKHLKKWLYWPWGEYRVLRDARAVLFTTEEERLLARQSFGRYRVRERVVSYGTVEPPDDTASLRQRFLAAYPTLSSRRLLLFLGRLHSKKGCDILLRAFASVAPSDPLLHLVIAGTGSDDTVEQLHALSRELNITDRITWTGLLQGGLKWGAFCASDAFVLPSHQENFGIAVVEALATGTPVLISDKINIWREIDADRAGFVSSDTVEGTVANLRRWLSLDLDSSAHMREQANLAFDTHFTIDAHVRKLLDVLQEEQHEMKRPDSEKAPSFAS